MNKLKLFENFDVNEGEQDSLQTALSALTNAKSIEDVAAAESEIVEYLEYSVVSPIWVESISDEGIALRVMPGSSLKSDVIEAAKKLKLDRWFDPEQVDFEDGGDDHYYTILPRGKKAESGMTDDEFVEDFVQQAVWDSEKWLPDGSEEGVIEDDLEKFLEYYNGEFLEKVYSDRKDEIIDKIEKRIFG